MIILFSLNMLKNKKKIKIIILSAVSCIVVFLLGVCIGAKCFSVQHKKIKFEAKNIRFYTIKKMLGKTITNDEKKVVKKFQESSEECINSFSVEERNGVNLLKDEVLSIAKGNDKISFRLKDLHSMKRKELVSLAKKIKRCNIKSIKALNKDERKMMRVAISKMEIDDIIKLYNGIK